MTSLFSLSNSAGHRLICRDDGNLTFGTSDEGTLVLAHGLPNEAVLLEAPGCTIASLNDGIEDRAAVLLFKSQTIVEGTIWLLHPVTARIVGIDEGAFCDPVGESGIAILELTPVAESPPGSLLSRLPRDLQFDQSDLTALFEQADPELLPVVRAMLPLFNATMVRTCWSSTEGAAKAPFLDVVREHGRERLQRYKSYTADLLREDALRFGWSIGEKSYGKPLIFEPVLGKLTIGRYCSMADPAIILGNHSTRTVTSYPFASLWFEWPGTTLGLNDHVSRDVTIGNDVWIGYNSIILPGAVIGDGSVIGAGCTVGGKIPPYSICVGNPGQVRGRRFDEATIERLLALRWWDWPDAVVDRYLPILLSEDIRAFLDKAEAEFGPVKESELGR